MNATTQADAFAKYLVKKDVDPNEVAKSFTQLRVLLRRAEASDAAQKQAAKEWWMGGNIFEEMGFYYVGPIDGHNLDVLVPILVMFNGWLFAALISSPLYSKRFPLLASLLARLHIAYLSPLVVLGLIWFSLQSKVFF